MTANEIKQVLEDKFIDENCGFRKKDIKVNGNIIQIKDYEHIQFEIEWDDDDYFGRCCYIKETYVGYDDSDVIVMEDSKHKTDDEILAHTLVLLGYYIASRF